MIRVAKLLFAAVLGVAFMGLRANAQGPCTESVIKAAKAEHEADDLYFFSSSINKPIVGKADIAKALAVVHANHKNRKSGPWLDERVVASPAGDMAYVYGSYTLSYDEIESGKHVEFTNAYLRVFKADGDTCKIEAEMYERER
jgi:hypothetical protein